MTGSPSPSPAVLPASFAPAPTDDGRRREFLAGALALALGVGGCGGSEPAAEAEDATRVVTDSGGRRVRVPAAPQRVVALDFGPIIASLVDLGLTPVGASTNESTKGAFSPLLGAAADRIQDVGFTGSVNLERVVELAPDLILTNTVYIDVPVERLQRIAPTVGFEGPNRLFDIMRFQARAVGREAQAEELLREFRAEITRSAARKQIAGRKVALVAVRGRSFSVFGPALQFGVLIDALSGEIVPRSVGGKSLTDASDELSLEAIPDLLGEADLVVLLRDFGGPDSDADVRRTLESRLWRRIPAVRRDAVRIVDIQAMVGSYGLAGQRRVLAQLAAG